MTAVPVEITVKRWLCPYCRRSHSKKPAAIGHATRCWSNPDTRTCRTCVHFDTVDSDPDTGYQGFLWCHAQNTQLPVESTPVLNCPLWEAKCAP